jgi:hypothetical protein
VETFAVAFVVFADFAKLACGAKLAVSADVTAANMKIFRLEFLIVSSKKIEVTRRRLKKLHYPQNADTTRSAPKSNTNINRLQILPDSRRRSGCVPNLTLW